MVVYISVDANNYLTGWSSTRSNVDDIEVNISRNHEALSNPEIFKYIDGELVKDEVKQQELIDERIQAENKPDKVTRNEMAILELASMVGSIGTFGLHSAKSALSTDKGGDRMIAILYAEKIIEGLWDYDNVGSYWKEEVKQILIAEGREDLIK